MMLKICHYLIVVVLAFELNAVVAQEKRSRIVQTSHSNSGSNGNSNSNSGNSGHSSNSASSAKCDKIEPCVKLSKANEDVKKCCVKILTDTCVPYCRYDITKKEIMDAFTHGDCGLDEARDYLKCLADNKDNTYCCNKKGILDGPRKICEPFCNPDSDDWPTEASGKYLKCLSQFDGLVKCHWAARTP